MTNTNRKKRPHARLAWLCALAALICMPLLVGCGDTGERQDQILIPKRSGPPYVHRVAPSQPYGHQVRGGAPYNHSARRGAPYNHTSTKGTSNTGLSRHSCNCLIQSSATTTQFQSYSVCANDVIDAATFSSSKCPINVTCFACACVPGAACTSRGD